MEWGMMQGRPDSSEAIAVKTSRLQQYMDWPPHLKAAGDLIGFILQLYTALLNAAHQLSKSWVQSLAGINIVASRAQALFRKVMQGCLASMILLRHHDSQL